MGGEGEEILESSDSRFGSLIDVDEGEAILLDTIDISEDKVVNSFSCDAPSLAVCPNSPNFSVIKS